MVQLAAESAAERDAWLAALGAARQRRAVFGAPLDDVVARAGSPSGAPPLDGGAATRARAQGQARREEGRCRDRRLPGRVKGRLLRAEKAAMISIMQDRSIMISIMQDRLADHDHRRRAEYT